MSIGMLPSTIVACRLCPPSPVLSATTAPDWLDGAVAGLGMAALCAAFAFRGLEKLFEGPSLAAATGLAFPTGDLLLLGLVVGSTAVLSGRSRATLVLIAIGMAIDSAGDTFSFAGHAHLATVVYGISWPAAILVFAKPSQAINRTHAR